MKILKDAILDHKCSCVYTEEYYMMNILNMALLYNKKTINLDILMWRSTMIRFSVTSQEEKSGFESTGRLYRVYLLSGLLFLV